MKEKSKKILLFGVLMLSVILIIGAGLHIYKPQQVSEPGKAEKEEYNQIIKSEEASPIQKTDQPVYVRGWAGDSVYLICYTDGNTSLNRDTSGTFIDKNVFTASLSRQQLINTNKSDYIGEIPVYDSLDSGSFGGDKKGSIFYRKNNYYVMYENENSSGKADTETEYTARSLMARWCLAGFVTKEVNFPCPVLLYISETRINDYREEYGQSYLGLLFDNFSFEECEDFYSRLDTTICEIDKEKKTITVQIGYGCEIIIDYSNETITGPAYLNSSEYYTEKYITLTGERMETPWIN